MKFLGFRREFLKEDVKQGQSVEKRHTERDSLRSN